MTLHYQVWPGKRVLVHLKDGTSFVDKWLNRKRDRAVFETRTVPYKQIRSMTIYKGEVPVVPQNKAQG